MVSQLKGLGRLRSSKGKGNDSVFNGQGMVAQRKGQRQMIQSSVARGDCSAQRAEANDSALIGKGRVLSSKGQGQITQP